MLEVKNKTSDIAFFEAQLRKYKKLIDADIAQFKENTQRTTLKKFGSDSRVATDAYLEVLSRGGKRIRGALVMLGYEMLGGVDTKMIVQAARAIEMIHAYVLITDDIVDLSASRRGGPSAHKLLAQYHQNNKLSGDSEHFGESMALNAAQVGNHAAQMLLANLNVDPQFLLKGISVLNYGLITTMHGQFNDIFNEAKSHITEEDVAKVMEWKTAHYTFLNPLTFGMVLAGADCGPTDAIAGYALHAGIAFQITDDILSTFGNEFESGKSPMDDMREGKQTLLTVYALKHASESDTEFIQKHLGNASLTETEFSKIKAILTASGALEYATKHAQKHVELAVNSLDKQKNHWEESGTQFLSGLAQSLIARKV